MCSSVRADLGTFCPFGQMPLGEIDEDWFLIIRTGLVAFDIKAKDYLECRQCHPI